MSDAGKQPSAGRVSACCALLLAVTVVVELVLGHHSPDDHSYRTGYRAADATAARTVMTRPGVTATVVCEGIADRTLAAPAAAGVNRHDFLIGCRTAVGDAME